MKKVFYILLFLYCLFMLCLPIAQFLSSSKVGFTISESEKTRYVNYGNVAYDSCVKGMSETDKKSFSNDKNSLYKYCYGKLSESANYNQQKSVENFENARKAIGRRQRAESDLNDLRLAHGELDVRKGQLDTKETQLETKETQLGTKETQLETKETQLETKETQLGTKETQLETKETQLETKETQLGTKETQLETKETQLETKETELDNKETELGNKEKSLKPREVLKSQLDKQVEKWKTRNIVTIVLFSSYGVFMLSWIIYFVHQRRQTVYRLVRDAKGRFKSWVKK